MGWGTWKGIEEHRDRIEMGRKRREAKGRNCGERVGGQGKGPQDPPTNGWMPRVRLGTWKGIGGYGDRIEMGRKKREKKAMNCGERGGEGGQGRGAQEPLTHGWVGCQGLGWMPRVGLENMEEDWGL